VALHDSLAIGDRVHTTSGMVATIAGITDDSVELEIAPGVITTWMKLAVRDRIEDDDDDDDDGDQDEAHYDVESDARDEADPTAAPKTAAPKTDS
jgi:preprotein translocase subunit YajC